MPNIDTGAPVVTNYEPEPTVRIYDGPMDIWILEVCDAMPHGAALVYVTRVGSHLLNVYARPAPDDREENNGHANTAYRTYHNPTRR